MINKSDLSKIELKAPRYDSFFLFQVDISWFVHNCRIIYPEDGEICKLAMGLPEFVNEEIVSVQNCAECYQNAFKFPDNSFTKPCAEPHPLIWCKAPGWNFWPAKAMSIRNGLVHVRFFQDHTTANIPPASCFMYTNPKEFYPGNRMYKNKEFEQALLVSVFNYTL